MYEHNAIPVMEILIETVLNKYHTKMSKSYYSHPINLYIYIEEGVWYELMNTKGGVDSTYWNFLQSKGTYLMGFPVYRVKTEGHGIKVYTEVN